jgi:hypothetical protein
MVRQLDDERAKAERLKPFYIVDSYSVWQRVRVGTQLNSLSWLFFALTWYFVETDCTPPVGGSELESELIGVWVDFFSFHSGPVGRTLSKWAAS